MESIWKKELCSPNFQTLQGDRTTDVLVIGGGITGLLCTHMLCQRGIECLLVEADRICSGVTGNTTAKITAQHGLCYSRIAKRFGFGAAKKYYEANAAAIDYYRSLSDKFPCDLEEKDSFVYSLRGEAPLLEELSVLRGIGAEVRFLKQLDLPMPTNGAVSLPRQCQMHPLRLLYGLSAALPILEGTRVEKIHGTEAITDRGRIRAGKIIIATHFPMINTHGFYFLKLYQSRSWVLCLKGARDTGGMYIDESDSGFSFRNAGERLLLGGGSHRTGKKSEGWRELERFASRYYPDSKIEARWATQDCMTLDGLPYIGRYSYGTEGVYVATGFEKWGMTLSAVAAEMLCDLVEGKEHPLCRLFSPSRSWMHPQLARNAGETLLNFLNPTVRRCPHMGCALKWNSQEHSWDCPCHGSRFDGEGRLLNEPAKRNIRSIKK